MTVLNPHFGVLAAASLTAMLALPVAAEPMRQHGAHVHGEATGNLSLDDEQLRLELTIPGVNLVGFEHPPRDEAQRDALADTLAFLNAGSWVDVHAAGRCELVSANAHTHGFRENDDHDHSHEHRHDDAHHHGQEHHGHDHHGHDHSHGGHEERHSHEHAHLDHHGHDHDHEHGHDHHHDGHHDHDHAEFHLVMNWTCQRPDALGWIDIDLFSDYPGNERMVIDVLTNRTASRERLQPNRIRINL
ncbi:MAG: ZrgA family zinc uptake protein [Wenzhouxiangella sp.]